MEWTLNLNFTISSLKKVPEFCHVQTRESSLTACFSSVTESVKETVNSVSGAVYSKVVKYHLNKEARSQSTQNMMERLMDDDGVLVFLTADARYIDLLHGASFQAVLLNASSLLWTLTSCCGPLLPHSQSGLRTQIHYCHLAQDCSALNNL